MSHFSVLVIGPDVEKQLAPYHEFECTGMDDEFVQDIDITADLRASYKGDTTRQLRAPDSTLHSPYDNQFYREFTEEELASVGRPMGSGCGGGISWSSRDWEDGRGYRAKVLFVPEGWTEEEVPKSQIQPFRDYVDEEEGKSLVLFGDEPDLAGEHKYGYALLDKKGDVSKVVRRTNPNKKWDWWTEGGRYSGRLLLKDGSTADSAVWGDVDVDAIVKRAEDRASKLYSLASAVLDGLPPMRSWDEIREDHPGNIDRAREEYHAQPRVTALRGADGDLAWMEPSDFSVSREEYLATARAEAISCFAVVKNGEWSEKGRMGWFGCVSDEKDGAAWSKFVADTLAELGPSTLVTFVDCHI